MLIMMMIMMMMMMTENVFSPSGEGKYSLMTVFIPALVSA
jgi:hypothetical protein